MKIENKQNISNITIKTKTHNLCPIGDDWYTCNINIDITPGKLIPDYIEVDKFIFDNIEKKEYIIENVVAEIFKYIAENYKPKHIKVTASVEDAIHSPVIVEKEGADI